MEETNQQNSALEPGQPRAVQPMEYMVLKYAQDKGSYILRADGNQKMGMSRVNLRDIVGHSFSGTYELKGRRFERVDDEGDVYADGDGEEEEEEPSTTAVAPSVISEADQAQFNTYSDSDINQYIAGVWASKASGEAKGVVKGDNSGYVDTNTAQKLSTADIAKLREKGLSGAEIIKSLMANSDTFGIKSDFAQAKYIKRKEKKYRKLFQLLPCNPQTICETATYKNRDKVMNLRYDMLAQILSHSGVHSGAHCLIFESMGGLITGAVAYRMQGAGRILTVYGAQQPHFEGARQYNLDAKAIEIIQPIPATEIGPAAKDVAAQGFYTPEPLPVEEEEERLRLRRARIAALNAASRAEKAGARGTIPSSSVVTTVADTSDAVAGASAMEVEDDVADEQETDDHNSKKRKRATDSDAVADGEDAVTGPTPAAVAVDTVVRDNLVSTGRVGLGRDRVHRFLRQGVDRLIIASKYRPLPILKQALHLLAPSAPLVIFHEFLEPLVDCFLYLTQHELAVKMVLSDTWLREYQNLPGRFRPEMFMSATGGFLLTGIHVGLPQPHQDRLLQEQRFHAQAHQQARQEKMARHHSRGQQTHKNHNNSNNNNNNHNRNQGDRRNKGQQPRK